VCVGGGLLSMKNDDLFKGFWDYGGAFITQDSSLTDRCIYVWARASPDCDEYISFPYLVGGILFMKPA
jgi:hypothetical protein